MQRAGGVPNGEPGAWEAFWRRAGDAAALAGRSPAGDVLARFWSTVLEAQKASRPGFSLLDLACGNGAVALAAAAMQDGPPPEPRVFALDRSRAAIDALRHRAPAVAAIVADARRLPFPDACFDIATSQFGIEYASAEAFAEAARVLAPGGTFAAVLHLKDGAMYRENAANLEAARGLEAAAVLPTLRTLFLADIAAAQGKGSRAAVRDADAALQSALAAVGGVLRRLGPAVSGGMVQRLHADVEHMRARIRFQNAPEVVRWSELMAQELVAFGGRMASMLEAAVDSERLEAIVATLSHRGLSMRLREPAALGRGTGEPSAWLLVATRD